MATSQATQLTQSDIHQLAKKVTILESNQNEVVIQISNSDRKADATYKVSVNKGIYSFVLESFHTSQCYDCRSNLQPLLETADRRTSFSTIEIASSASKQDIATAICQLSAHLSKNLHWACRIGAKSSLQKLISQGINLDTKDPTNHLCAPLFIAAKEGYLECVKLLVESGANVNIENDEHATALMTASYRGHDKMVKYLISKGADVNAFTVTNKITPAMHAALQGNKECIKHLLSSSPDLSKKNNYGETALFLATKNGHVKVVKLLLKHSCNEINIQSNSGYTPLLVAARSGYSACVELLLQKAARVDIKTGEGETALQWAQKNDHRGCAQQINDYMSTLAFEQAYSKIETEDEFFANPACDTITGQ